MGGKQRERERKKKHRSTNCRSSPCATFPENEKRGIRYDLGGGGKKDEARGIKNLLATSKHQSTATGWLLSHSWSVYMKPVSILAMDSKHKMQKLAPQSGWLWMSACSAAAPVGRGL